MITCTFMVIGEFGPWSKLIIRNESVIAIKEYTTNTQYLYTERHIFVVEGTLKEVREKLGM